MNTLYVSDLDGTLLNSDVKISENSKNIINSLIDKGMNFTVATARSLVSASDKIEGLNLKLPVVVYNGTFTMMKDTGKIVNSNYFNKADRDFIIENIKKSSLNPLVYSFVNNVEKVSYNKNFVNQGTKYYLDVRGNDPRMNPLNSSENLYEGDIFYFTIIGDYDKVKEFYNSIKENNNIRVTFQKEIYNESYWCEIMPITASKANGILQLKETYNFDRVVTFGDAINDVPMFQISDECYAMDNACKELKSIATKVILSNNQDGVALFLQEKFNS